MKILLTLFVVCLASRINGDGEDCQNEGEEINLKFEVQNDQDTQSDERFVAVHVDKLGVDVLNPEKPEIHDIVKPFLTTNLKFLYAINVTREIVNGVKYEIFFVVKNEEEEEIYCVIDVLEKPWLMTNSKKFRKMTYNNCSLENPPDDDDKTRFQYKINPTFVDQRTELSEPDFSDMEDQIVTMRPKKTSTTRKTTTTTMAGTTTEEEEEITLAPLDSGSKNILDNFFNMNNFFPPPPTPSTTTSTSSPLSNMNLDALDEMFGIKKVEKSNAEVRTDESSLEDENVQQKRVEIVENAIPSKNETALKDLEIEIKKVFSELFQSDPEFQMNIIALINRKDDSNAQKNYNYVISILTNKLKEKIETLTERQNEEEGQQVTIEPLTIVEEENREKRSTNIRGLTKNALDTLDKIDEDDKKRVLVDIIGVKGKKNVLKVEAAIANSRCKENSRENGECEKEIEINSIKVCLLEISEINGELKNSECVPATRETEPKGRLVGGVESFDKDHPDVTLFLNEALAEINVGEDPDYSVTEVLSATTQVVAGRLVKIQAKLLVGNNDVTCNFSVWERAWIADGREITVKCDNEKEFKLKQKPAGYTARSRKRRDVLVSEPIKNENQNKKLVGELKPIGNDDEKVLGLLSTHLKRLDTGSDAAFELVAVEKITKQVLSGLSYKVKGTFRAGKEDVKNCTIDIWTRPWIKGDEETQIKADCENAEHYKAKRSKRSVRPMPGRHHSRESSEFKAHDIKSEILFENFAKKYHRRYANDLEHKMRHRIFKKNLHKIDMLNKHEQGTAKYGITPFSDLTEKEYLKKTGLVVRHGRENELNNPIAEIPDMEVSDLPEEFDWTEKGAVTTVKDQGNCGSCWSFSVTGNVEGLHAIKTGKLEAYSEQELLDCDTTDNACNGGYMDDAFKAIEKIGGLELESEYPYKAKKQKKCLFNSTMAHVKVKGVVDMPKGDEVAMQKYLVQNGPISIGINAAAMQFYRGGVSHPWKILCRKSDLDHGVLVVGYGIKSYPMFNKTLPYWKIKNSWGPKWGEQGFYRIYRGDNSCGVAEMASSAVLE